MNVMKFKNYRLFPLLIIVNESVEKIMETEEWRIEYRLLEIACQRFKNFLETHPDYEPTRIFGKQEDDEHGQS